MSASARTPQRFEMTSLTCRENSKFRSSAAELPLGVVRENVVLLCRYRVACGPALGVVLLWRMILRIAGPIRSGRNVILKHGISPAAGVRELLAILHHEVNVVERVGHQRRTGEGLLMYRIPMDLRQLGAIRERLAISGNTGLERVDHLR